MLIVCIAHAKAHKHHHHTKSTLHPARWREWVCFVSFVHVCSCYFVVLYCCYFNFWCCCNRSFYAVRGFIFVSARTHLCVLRFILSRCEMQLTNSHEWDRVCVYFFNLTAAVCLHRMCHSTFAGALLLWLGHDNKKTQRTIENDMAKDVR